MTFIKAKRELAGLYADREDAERPLLERIEALEAVLVSIRGFTSMHGGAAMTLKAISQALGETQ